MKKSLFAICMAGIMLTGCGNTAGTADSSTSAADASSSAESASEQADSVAEAQPSEDKAEQDVTYFDWAGIDMPIQPEMHRDKGNSIVRTFHNIPIDTVIENPVYFAMNSIYPEPGDDGEYPTYTPEELPELLEITFHRSINHYYSSDEVFSKKTVESTLKGEFMGEPAVGEKGTVIAVDDTKLNYVVYYVFADMPDLYLESKVPMLWIAFTPSDDKEALELMERAAEAPLKQAKLHEN